LTINTTYGDNEWYTSITDQLTNAWSFNAHKLLNTENETYTFELKPSGEGIYLTPSYFQRQFVVKNSQTGTSFYYLSDSGVPLQTLTDFE
jgi:hypothetical protein|tara:strand:- start:51607 stop:51876 length:270 start_codon:yes stop_codon:yes gene_type:complete